jgi:hypothetical protein
MEIMKQGLVLKYVLMVIMEIILHDYVNFAIQIAAYVLVKQIVQVIFLIFINNFFLNLTNIFN